MQWQPPVNPSVNKIAAAMNRNRVMSGNSPTDSTVQCFIGRKLFRIETILVIAIFFQADDPGRIPGEARNV